VPDEGCLDVDNGATDRHGKGCIDYRPHWCGNNDDNEFVSNAMCCACGGGTRGIISDIL